MFVWAVRALKTELPVGQVWPWQERKGLIFHWSTVSLVCGCRKCEARQEILTDMAGPWRQPLCGTAQLFGGGLI